MVAQGKQYTLMPCSGVGSLGISRGHLYKVEDGEAKLGFATREVAFRKFGENNCYVSEYDTLCPLCFEYNSRRLQEKLRRQLNLIE